VSNAPSTIAETTTSTGINMSQAPLQSKSEMKEHIGPKIAAWGIVAMIIYLVIVQ